MVVGYVGLVSNAFFGPRNVPFLIGTTKIAAKAVHHPWIHEEAQRDFCAGNLADGASASIRQRKCHPEQRRSRCEGPDVSPSPALPPKRSLTLHAARSHPVDRVAADHVVRSLIRRSAGFRMTAAKFCVAKARIPIQACSPAGTSLLLASLPSRSYTRNVCLLFNMHSPAPASTLISHHSGDEL